MKSEKKLPLCRSDRRMDSARWAAEQAEGVPEALEQVFTEAELGCRYIAVHQDTSRPGSDIPPHRHDFMELLLCKSAGVAYLLDGQRIALQRGDILTIPPGVLHCPLMQEVQEPYQRDVLWISRAYLEGAAKLCPEGLPRYPQVVRTNGTGRESLWRMFHSGVREAERHEPNWELALLANTAQLLVGIRRAGLEREEALARMKRSKRTELPERCMAFVQENLAQRITLADVAKSLYVSQSTVSHVFREKTGHSFYSYVTLQRLTAAREKLLLGVPMEEVSREVGFANYSGFYRAFCREYGVSPSQFINLAQAAAGDKELP